MDEIWNEDGGLAEEFATSFGRWVAQQGGDLDEVTESKIVCEFDDIGVTIGMFEATGRKQFELTTLREEIELRMITKYELADGKLVLQTGRGSRRFVFDAPGEEWHLEKRPV